MSFSNVHRRSNTMQQNVEQWRSTMTTISDSTDSLPSWRHRRANSIQEGIASLPSKPIASLPPNPLIAMQKDLTSKTEAKQASNRDAAAIAKTRQRPSAIEHKRSHSSKTSSTLPPVPTSHVRSGSRADKVDNWRVKSASTNDSRSSSPKEERRRSTDSIRSKTSEAPSSCESSSSEEVKTPKEEEVPQMLPPIRVSMEPGPVEVLPPLRFSMEPAIKGRSPWRFVLPSPKATVENESFNFKTDEEEEEGEVTITSFDDLPYWLEGNRDDLIIRMGTSPIKRPLSPSARSTTSSITSTEPALDYGDDYCSSSASSVSASPDLAPHQLEFCLPEVEDTMETPMPAKHEFALPSFSAAAPLPSHLPLPSFLLRK